jgi:hypothetical protein
MAASSGIQWIDFTFDLAVHMLYWTADLFGVTYEEINVYIFVILMPSVTLFSLLFAFWSWRRCRN